MAPDLHRCRHAPHQRTPKTAGCQDPAIAAAVDRAAPIRQITLPILGPPSRPSPRGQLRRPCGLLHSGRQGRIRRTGRRWPSPGRRTAEAGAAAQPPPVLTLGNPAAPEAADPDIGGRRTTTRPGIGAARRVGARRGVMQGIELRSVTGAGQHAARITAATCARWRSGAVTGPGRPDPDILSHREPCCWGAASLAAGEPLPDSGILTLAMLLMPSARPGRSP